LILISPWSRITTEGAPSPKNYPHWEAVVGGLLKAGYEVAQLSRSGEPDIQGVTRRMDDLTLQEIGALIATSETWIAVDNFLPHMAWTLNQPGVVIFGLSDPDIFGHPGNINLLKSRHFLRTRQFGLWSQEKPNPEAFVSPEIVIRAVEQSIKQRRELLL
jgi:ADP-heptose:LPS heptosyltransferase